MILNVQDRINSEVQEILSLKDHVDDEIEWQALVSPAMTREGSVGMLVTIYIAVTTPGDELPMKSLTLGQLPLEVADREELTRFIEMSFDRAVSFKLLFTAGLEDPFVS